MLGYQFSVVNGKGYSSPARSKSVDFEGRVSLEAIQALDLLDLGVLLSRESDAQRSGSEAR